MAEAGKREILIVGHDLRFQCSPNQTLLRSMERVGGRAIPVGCRGGGCGICKIEVLSGKYRTDRMSRACVSEDEEANGVALACRVYPEGDLAIRVVGKVGRMIGERLDPPKV